MAKTESYNGKSREALLEECTKLRAALRDAEMEKLKTGNAKAYRETRKNIARVLTALNALPAQIEAN